MASTSVRFIAQGSKLQAGTTSFSTVPLSLFQHNQSFVRPSKGLRPGVRSCTLSPRIQQGVSEGRRPFSARVRTCTTTSKASTQHRAIAFQARWTNERIAQIPRQTLITSSNVIQKRFASNRPSVPDGIKGDGGPLTSTKIKAPEILKKALASTPHENIYTLPNILTFSRLISAPAIGYFILNSQPIAALALFAYAGVTDLVDGWLARRYNSQTVVGTILDPMADKTLMTVTIICLALQEHIPLWLAVIVLGRDVGLAISACYYRYISLPPPKTFTRYWDFSLPSAEVRPTEISKINTLLQLLLVGNAMVLPVLPTAFVDAWNLVGVFEGWQFLVAGTTVWSGLSYVFSNDAVKILSQQEQKQQQQQQQEEQRKKTEEDEKRV